MQIRCYRCGWSFAIKKEEAAFALQALEASGGSHYDSNCPRCRHSNRISLEQLKKSNPSAGEESASGEPLDTGEVAEDGRELEAEILHDAEGPEPKNNDQVAQPKSESDKPKKRRRRKRG